MAVVLSGAPELGPLILKIWRGESLTRADLQLFQNARGVKKAGIYLIWINVREQFPEGIVQLTGLARSTGSLVHRDVEKYRKEDVKPHADQRALPRMA